MLSLITLFAGLLSPDTGEDWPQWGGPNRDFQARSEALAEEWPKAGPRVVWRRALGNGTSAVAVVDDVLYTLYGEGMREIVVALDPTTGKTRWSYGYDVEYAAHREDYGGPHATPIVCGDVVVTVSIDAKVHALDRRTGELRWRRDLVAEHDVDLPQSGYAASPVAWGGTVILPGLGGPGPGALALDVASGKTVWARQSFLSSHASPLVISAGGREHVVFHGMNFLVGIDPENGDLLWRKRLRVDAADNVVFSPLWIEERSLFLISHRYDGKGTRALRLEAEADGFEAEELWTNRRLKVEHGNGVVLGDTLYASDGSEPAYLVGIDIDTGKSRFKERGIPKANFVGAGEHMVLLDEEGTVHLARPEGDELELLASAEVLRPVAWAAPTLVGRRLYLRDRFAIVALELP